MTIFHQHPDLEDDGIHYKYTTCTYCISNTRQNSARAPRKKKRIDLHKLQRIIPYLKTLFSCWFQEVRGVVKCRFLVDILLQITYSKMVAQRNDANTPCIRLVAVSNGIFLIKET